MMKEDAEQIQQALKEASQWEVDMRRKAERVQQALEQAA
jgi:hypothetical protein